MRPPVPPGLTCSRCHLPFTRQYARPTVTGWVHARPCESPVELTTGTWVRDRRGIARWRAPA